MLLGCVCFGFLVIFNSPKTFCKIKFLHASFSTSIPYVSHFALMQIKSWKKEKVPKMTHPLKRRGSNFWVYFAIQGVLEVSNLGVHSPQWCTVRNLPPNTWAIQYKHTYLPWTTRILRYQNPCIQVTMCFLIHKQRTGIPRLTRFLWQPKICVRQYSRYAKPTFVFSNPLPCMVFGRG